MVVTKSSENDIVTCNEVMVQDEHPSTEVSSHVMSSNNNDVVTKHQEQIETKECLVHRRFSLRLQNRAKDNGNNDNKKRSITSDNNGNNSDKKRARIEVGETCISDFHVFDELDFRGVLMTRESLRSFNIRRLESAQVEQNKSKMLDNLNQRDTKFLRTKEVDKNWVEKGIPTSIGCKYLLKQLRRLAKLGTDKVVHLARGKVSNASEYPCLVCKDLSNGQEAIAIPVTNEYDDPPFAPEGFAYTTSLQYASNVEVPSSGNECKCKGSCRNTSTCSCALLNGSEFPYVVGRKSCRLMESRDILYECGPRCGCGPNCDNKITQKGLNYKLEVYRTTNKGWAVRTWEFIPCGAPICEYHGVVRRSEELELESALGNAYIFDIDCLHTINEVDGRERRLRDVSLPSNTFVEKRDEETTENEPQFSIDANSFGNVARLINHSCDPNLFVQCVLSSYLDVRLARIVLFAAQDIPPYQELTYDYGYRLDSVVGPDGIPKQLHCHCGAADCRKRLY